MNYKEIISAIKNKNFQLDISSCSVYGFNNKYVDEKSKTNPISLYAKYCLKTENFIRTNLKNRNKTIIGYGATAKVNTVLNFCKIKDETIDYFLDTTPGKIGKYMPGSHLFVQRYSKPLSSQADYVFLGAYLKTYMQIGNAVPPIVAKEIANVIKKYLNYDS